MGGGIPFTDIHYFATIKQIDDFEEFHYIIRKLDAVISKHRDKHGNSSSDNSGNK